MTDEKKSIKLALDEKTEQRLKAAATRKGVTVEQYCSEAVIRELNNDSPAQVILFKGAVRSGTVALRGRLSVKDSAEALLALRDEISRGKTTSTNSVDLIREARVRRGRRQEELGRS